MFLMKVKKSTTYANMASLLMIPTVSVAAHSFINAKMPSLLQDEAYFNV